MGIQDRDYYWQHRDQQDQQDQQPQSFEPPPFKPTFKPKPRAAYAFVTFTCAAIAIGSCIAAVFRLLRSYS